MCNLKSIIEFKEHGLKLQFLSNNLDSRLYVITLSLAGYIYFNFKKSLTITEIFRTQLMQDKYYEEDEDYQKDSWRSVHQDWRGIDISLKYFTINEITLIGKFLNQNFIYTSDKNIKTGLIHCQWGWHLHLQVDKDNITSIIKTNS